MIRFAALWILLVIASVAICQDDESKCCCTTYDTSVCIARVHKQVDAALEKTYQEAVQSVTDGYTAQDVRNLRDAQRAWVAYRNAACKAEYGLWGGGSGGPNAHAICLIRLTRQRTAELTGAYLAQR